MRVLILALMLIGSWIEATTVTTNLNMAVTTDGSAGPITALAHPTPIVQLTSNIAATNIQLHGISGTGAVDGETVTVVRTGFNGKLELFHVSGSAAVGDQIILPGTGISPIDARASVEFVRYGSYWYVSANV